MIEEKRDLFKEFIEELARLDDLRDRDAENVAVALDKWIREHYPDGFEIDYNRQDLMVKIIKKSVKMSSLIMTSKLRPYLDAIIDMRWAQIAKEEEARYKKLKKKFDATATLMKFAREIFVLGYCLRSLERETEKKEDKKQQNAKDS